MDRLLWVFAVLSCFSYIECAPYKNVLVIIGDDAGFETQVYNNNVSKTPNINKLASQGVVFNHAYTSVSSCSPSRSTIMSGLPQHQNGMYGLHHNEHHFSSFDNVMSLPRILKQHNFRTGIIGKKHVGPEWVYPYDYAQTEENHGINQVGRNITNMNLYMKEFLKESEGKPFFLYMGFHDPHRCRPNSEPDYGPFCNKFGNGEPGMGLIPDWKPVLYSPDEVIVPYFVQDTPAARMDIAAQYTTYSRLDQGIGLFLRTLEEMGHKNDTLVIFSSDNGIPFPSGRTNLFDPGMAEPMIVSSPAHMERAGQRSDAMVTLLDIVPTALDWLDIPYPKYKILSRYADVKLPGRSLLPILKEEPKQDWDIVYASHNLHEVTMYYPMRVLRSRQYKLIHNLNHLMPFPIDQDFYVSFTFQDILNRTVEGRPLNWYKTLKEYYYRDEWELYDIIKDPKEMNNLAYNAQYANVLKNLKLNLSVWQNATDDPWICSPGGVLEYSGAYAGHPQCLPMYNGVS